MNLRERDFLEEIRRACRTTERRLPASDGLDEAQAVRILELSFFLLFFAELDEHVVRE